MNNITSMVFDVCIAIHIISLHNLLCTSFASTLYFNHVLHSSPFYAMNQTSFALESNIWNVDNFVSFPTTQGSPQ